MHVCGYPRTRWLKGEQADATQNQTEEMIKVFSARSIVLLAEQTRGTVLVHFSCSIHRFTLNSTTPLGLAQGWSKLPLHRADRSPWPTVHYSSSSDGRLIAPQEIGDSYESLGRRKKAVTGHNLSLNRKCTENICLGSSTNKRGNRHPQVSPSFEKC